MFKKLTALSLCFIIGLAFCACSTESSSPEKKEEEEKFPEIGTKIGVSKIEENEDWVVENENILEDFSIPQFNIKGENAEKINNEIAEKIKGANEKKLSGVEFSFGEKDALLSLTFALKYETKTEYFAYNISLADGKTPSNESIMQHFGLKPYQFRAICAEVMRLEYAAMFRSFGDSNPGEYSRYLKKSTTVENLKECIPYVSAGEKLCFVGKLYNLSGEELLINREAVQRGLENGSF